MEDFDGAIKETDHIIDAIFGNCPSRIGLTGRFQFQGRSPRTVPESH